MSSTTCLPGQWLALALRPSAIGEHVVVGHVLTDDGRSVKLATWSPWPGGSGWADLGAYHPGASRVPAVVADRILLLPHPSITGALLGPAAGAPEGIDGDGAHVEDDEQLADFLDDAHRFLDEVLRSRRR